MHVHLREPGEEYKETIASGTLAAATGGFAAVCAMPNTHPANDCRSVTDFILKEAQKTGSCRVFPIAAITRGLEGRALCEYGELAEAGARGISDDGRPVRDPILMRRAMEYAQDFGLPVLSHCEDLSLSGRGVMNEGPVATRMGLAGIPNAAESIIVERDIALCRLTKCPLHICHVSCAESVDAVRRAKELGLPVTAETAPHYFTLTDAAVADYDTNAKVNPPLRSEADRQAVLHGLRDGTIDVIASDHAPHSSIEKDVEFDIAASGISGLETSLALTLVLVERGILSMEDAVRKLSTNPAGILRLENAAGIRQGASADITIIDPEKTFAVDRNSFASKGRNTPFHGFDLKGHAVLTMVAGRVVFDVLRK
jgi:dihydroorotase